MSDDVKRYSRIGNIDTDPFVDAADYDAKAAECEGWADVARQAKEAHDKLKVNYETICDSNYKNLVLLSHYRAILAKLQDDYEAMRDAKDAQILDMARQLDAARKEPKR